MLKLEFTKDDFTKVVSGQDLGNSDNDVLMVMVVMMMRWLDRNTDSGDVDDVIKDDKGTEAISTVRWQGTSLICVQSFLHREALIQWWADGCQKIIEAPFFESGKC